jgi:SWI/SNF-related matrix-associated actin-dependent regulator 1 of chromatin subfamily A
VRVIFIGGLFVAQFPYEARNVPKSAGFVWDRLMPRNWATKDLNTALGLERWFAKSALDEALRRIHIQDSNVHKSALTTIDEDFSCPVGLSLLPFQRAGVAYALERNATLIADEMGVGKTIQALTVINADPTMRRSLIVCPENLRINWQRESAKWLMRNPTIAIAYARDEFPVLHSGENVVIVGYKSLRKFREQIRSTKWDMLICDENHFLKNAKAQCTQEICGSGKHKIAPLKPRRAIFLTGTPMPNRPAELWTMLKYFGIFSQADWMSYHRKYCDAEVVDDHINTTGASNLDELQRLLRGSCMVRRLKKDVLKELPPKRRRVVPLEIKGGEKILKREKELAENEDTASGFRLDVSGLGGFKVTFEEVTTLRHDTGVLKITAAALHILDVLEAQQQVIVFCVHHDVTDGVMKVLADADIMVGHVDGRNTKDRQQVVDDFQAGKLRAIVVGKAGWVGITLTAAYYEVFVEHDWTPANMKQAEDRAHRIGQLESVNVDYLVLANSIDEHVLTTAIDKGTIEEAALDMSPTVHRVKDVDDFGTPAAQEYWFYCKEKFCLYHATAPDPKWDSNLDLGPATSGRFAEGEPLLRKHSRAMFDAYIDFLIPF